MLRSGVGGEDFGTLKEGIEVVNRVAVLPGNCLRRYVLVRLTRDWGTHSAAYREPY